MIREMEALTADAVVGEATDAAHPSHTHANCLNCDAHLYGHYCHVCGQTTDDHHRSIRHLLWEAIESFTHFDGRLAKTIPALLFHPGQLARDHIEGRRQRHVPPFRLFLITLLIFMFTAELAITHDGKAVVHTSKDVRVQDMPGVRQVHVGGSTINVVPAQDANAFMQGRQAHSAFERWLKEHLGRAAQNPDYYLMVVFDWAHRLAVLMLPILAGLLTLCYVYKRQFYVYDHLVVAMQYLSFCFLVWAPVWLFPKAVSDWLFLGALAWTPFNLYQILRGAYGSRRIGAAAKAMVLWSSTVIVFGLLLTGLMAYALNKM